MSTNTTRHNLQKGHQYTKQDIYQIFSVPPERQGGNFNTGYNNFNNEIFIFCYDGNDPANTENFNNQWNDDGTLTWYTKSRAASGHSQVVDLLNNSIPKYIFTRVNGREPFAYQGEGTALSSSGDQPVEIIWQVS